MRSLRLLLNRAAAATRHFLRTQVARRWRGLDRRQQWITIAVPIGLLALALVTPERAEADAAERHTWPRQEILDAIRFVESSDRPNPPDGDDGLAIGPYQIHEVYLARRARVRSVDRR